MNAKVLLWRFNCVKVGIAIVLQVYGGCKIDDIQPINGPLNSGMGYLRVHFERMPLYCRKQQEADGDDRPIRFPVAQSP
jgi:hypothetical protein